MYCQKCGVQVGDEARYCHRCGAALVGTSAEPASPPHLDTSQAAPAITSREKTGVATATNLA